MSFAALYAASLNGHDGIVELLLQQVILLQYTATRSNTLQHTVTHCDALQHAATCDLGTSHHSTYTATRCNTLQHAATRCNTLQHAATHCNTLHPVMVCVKLFHVHGNMLQHAATLVLV